MFALLYVVYLSVFNVYMCIYVLAMLDQWTAFKTWLHYPQCNIATE